MSEAGLFTLMHLADAFIQSDLQCIQAIHLLISMCVPWDQLPADCHVNVPEYSSLVYSLSE